MTISAYGALHAAGAGFALLLAFRTADRAGLPRVPSTVFLTVGFVGSFVAAKVVAAFALGGDPSSTDLLQTGGTSTLVVPAALVLGTTAAAALRLPAARLLDVACAGAAPGLALARLGCLFAGCCSGGDVRSPWLRSLLASGGLPPVQPLPLYEALVLAAASPLLLRRAATARPGTTTALFALVWGALRLALIPLTPARGPEWTRTAQLAAVGMCVVVAGAALAASRSRSRQPAGDA